jgi:hypothetical protein
MRRFIVRGKLPNGEEIFFGTYQTYNKADDIVEDLVNGEFDDAVVEEINEHVPRQSRWWTTLAKAE